MDITARTRNSSSNQIMRAITSALCAGLFVLVCWFGAPDAQSAAQLDGVEVDAHADGVVVEG